jgi:hypothetical protein
MKKPTACPARTETRTVAGSNVLLSVATPDHQIIAQQLARGGNWRVRWMENKGVVERIVSRAGVDVFRAAVAANDEGGVDFFLVYSEKGADGTVLERICVTAKESTERGGANSSETALSSEDVVFSCCGKIVALPSARAAGGYELVSGAALVVDGEADSLKNSLCAFTWRPALFAYHNGIFAGIMDDTDRSLLVKYGENKSIWRESPHGATSVRIPFACGTVFFNILPHPGRAPARTLALLRPPYTDSFEFSF